MTKLLKAASILIVVVFAAYFLLIDELIEAQLERRGSNALQAPLAIGKVTFHVFPASLTLHDVHIGNARLPTHTLVQADELSLPLSLRGLLAHQLIVDNIDVHGLRFHRQRDGQNAAIADTASATNSPQLRDALQRAQHMLNHPLASNTIDPNVSLSGAILADQFKPLLAQISTALNAFTTSSGNLGDWQILARRTNIDGALDFGSNSLRFTGTLDNVTPQPALFNTVTQFELHQAEGEAATLQIKGSLDKRKLAQAALRFDLNNFPLAQWPLSNDPELKLVIVSANANIQALLSLTGNQFDFNALTRFQQTRFDVASGNSDIARAIAEVWRRTDAFDIHLQASGDLADPALKINSSLDVPLANALRQLQPASSTLPPSNVFPAP